MNTLRHGGATAETLRSTDAPYSSREARMIREMRKTPGTPCQCPRCTTNLQGTDLESYQLTPGVVLLRCPTCRRMMTVAED